MAKHSLVELVEMWNEATAPYVLRTDAEHLRCQAIARAINKRMFDCGYRYGYHWGEWSTGSRKVIKR